MARPLSVLLIYLLIMALLVGVLTQLLPLLAEQVGLFVQRAPDYYDRAQGLATEWFDRYQAVPPDVRETLEGNLEQFGGNVAGAVQAGLFRTTRMLTQTLGFLIGMLIVPFWTFYVLKDERELMQGLESLIPEGQREDARNIQAIVDGVLGAYLRGQVVLSLAVGIMATIGLLAIGVDFALLLGMVAGALEILPTIGPVLGAIPALIIAGLQSPVLALWTAVMFVVVQQVENIILVPYITGESVRMRPAVIMVVLIVGGGVMGVLGMVIAVPLAATLRDVAKYLLLRLSDEGIPPAEALARVRG
jgi:predicted PurR-regulated permease PerM